MGEKLRKPCTEKKQVEEALSQNEQYFGLKLDNNLSPSRMAGNLELADILDIPAIQSLMDDLYELTHITTALVDLKGNVPAIAGWQDICTKFHRFHPETCKCCVESDTKLSLGVAPGELKLYRCKNNMWDVATPLIVGGQHIGNIFSGHFFFEDEPLEYEFFRSQARKYGFNEEEYIAALEKVPRLSRQAVNKNMSFFMKLANMISQLSHSNFKLSQSLAECDTLLDALRESEDKYRNIVETANEGIWVVDAENKTIYVNKKMTEMLGFSQEEMIGRSGWKFTDDENKVVSITNIEKRQQDIGESHEFKLICRDGSPLWTLVNTRSFFGKDGKFAGSIGMFTDITRRKQEENRICRYNRILEGINKIFSNVVQAKTEEELGNTCLSVALKMTGSQFGFINGMDADGLLHNVAKSKLAREQCLMYDKTEHRSPFAVHGLYGSVIINEKAFFTNDPQSHPDSRGLPEGHPPIRSFLGVPLVQDGKTIGLIAVANRKNGYSYEQQEDLEAIAPAVTQALQRKKSEEALKFSNLYNRSLIEASLDPLITIGPEGKITDVNGAAEQVTGYSRNELIGTDFSYYFTEPEKALTGYQQVFLDGEVRDYSLGIHHRDGHITPVLYNASFYKDENGKVIGVFAAARDITELKKAEEALKRAHDNLEKLVEERTSELEKSYNSLKESEKNLAEAQKIAHLGSWEWNLITKEIWWSDEYYRIFGLKPQGSAPTYNEFLSYIHPEDRDIVINAIKEASNGKLFSIDHRIILPGGEEKIVHVQPEITFNEENNPVRIRGILQDITERKKTEKALRLSEERYRIVAEQTGQIIYEYNIKEDTFAWAGDVEKITGFTPDEFKNIGLRNKNRDFCLSRIHPEDRNLFLENHENFQMPEDTYRIEYRFRNKNEEYIFIEDNFICQRDENGNAYRIIGASKNITERKKTEIFLANIENARKREIHHRIKNNLQVISSLLDLEVEKFKSRGRVEYLEVLEAFRESQDRIISIALIHEELHEGNGNNELNFSPYLEKLVKNLFQAYSFKNMNIGLDMDLEDNIFFDIDIAVPLGLIVNEIISNSLKYAFSGRTNGIIQIRLCKELCKEEDTGILNDASGSIKGDYENKVANFILTVSDNGVGIPENINIEGSDTLGFQLIAILVDQLEGKLELKRDSGTEFTIKFAIPVKE